MVTFFLADGSKVTLSQDQARLVRQVAVSLAVPVSRIIAHVVAGLRGEASSIISELGIARRVEG